MITFKYDYNKMVEVATFLIDSLGQPVEGSTWFWHSDASDHEDCTEQIRIWNVTPAATFALLKWGV